MIPGFLLQPGDSLVASDLRLFTPLEETRDGETIHLGHQLIPQGQPLPRIGSSGGVISEGHPGHFFRPTAELPNPEADLLKEKLLAQTKLAESYLKQLEAMQAEVRIERARADQAERTAGMILAYMKNPPFVHSEGTNFQEGAPMPTAPVDSNVTT